VVAELQDALLGDQAVQLVALEDFQLVDRLHCERYVGALHM
jgi:hypothetical protein